MAQRISAGDLYYKVDCQKRIVVADGYGNTVGQFQSQFTIRAAYRHLRGGEAVLAARLENRHPIVITVRASSQTRLIDSSWRFVDVRDGTVWAVRDVTRETDRAFISFLCERGVAA